MADDLYDYHSNYDNVKKERSQLCIGVDVDTHDLDKAFGICNLTSTNFACCPLVDPSNRRWLIDNESQEVPFLSYSEAFFNTSQWSNQVVGKISEWIDLDSDDEKTRLNSEMVLKQEISFAVHMSLTAVILPKPKKIFVNYARVLSQIAQDWRLTFLQLFVPIPLTIDGVDDEHKNDDAYAGDQSWKMWNTIRTLCAEHVSICIALEISGDLPTYEQVERWISEPVKIITVPTSSFLTNRKGYPVLSKRHQECVVRLFQLDVQVVISGQSMHSSGLITYQQYISHLYKRQPNLTQQESYEKPFFDYLQTPLQPLQDNLQSQTYETFERDPVKYARYEEAITKALLQRASPDSTFVVMVVGAGRGPLVNACLKASHTSKREIEIFAIEKNPNAVVTLNRMNRMRWKDKVTVVSTDMRVWKPKQKADIIVSELLGSFGDNELSPECLDGAQKFLKEDGISIPCDYSSFLAPISTTKLWREAKGLLPTEEVKSLETPYVVKLHNFYQIAESQECFQFEHPNRSQAPLKNVRFKSLTFHAKEAAVLHGFAGYFYTTLYDDVFLSIDPATFSDGMFSWFPVYFPIRTPMRVKKDDEIEVHFWRNISTEKRKMWYEWCVTSPDQSYMHNVNGRSNFCGL